MYQVELRLEGEAFDGFGKRPEISFTVIGCTPAQLSDATLVCALELAPVSLGLDVQDKEFL